LVAFFTVAQDSVGGLDGLPKDATFLDYLYFSLMTITSLGYGGVEPASAPTRLLVSLEVLVGIGWMVIVFAAVVAYLEGRFPDIRDKDPPAAEEATMQQLEQLTRERAKLEEQRNEVKE
jgi:voltage-gated potassium channel Kch